jgi:spore coat protein CotH
MDAPQVSYFLKSSSPLDLSGLIPNAKPSQNWILYAPFLDLSLIRNAFAYGLFSEMGHFSAKSIPIELVVNGNYEGIYYLIEKIDGSPARLDLASCDTNNVGYPLPFLAEIGQAKESDQVINHPSGWAIIHDLNYSKKINLQILASAASGLGLMEKSAIIGSKNLSQLIDFCSFADFIIIQELFKNVDAYRLSTFFHKRCSMSDSLIHAGPIWDFNLTLGISNERDGKVPSGWIYLSGDNVDEFWPSLMSHAEFKMYLKTRYKALRKGILSQKNIEKKMEQCERAINSYKELHYMRYPWPNKKFWPYTDVPKTYDEEILSMKTFLSKRLNWMDNQLLSN